MYFPILTKFKTDTSIGQELAIYLWKIFILDLNFQNEDHSFANSLFNILIISRKCITFQFLTSDIRMHFPILTGV